MRIYLPFIIGTCYHCFRCSELFFFWRTSRIDTNTTTSSPTIFGEDSTPILIPVEAEKPTQPRVNIYEHVTHRILSQLEAGQIPWRKTWASGLPKSLTTGKEYRGINILLLGTSGFASRYWVTYRQA